MERKMIIFGRSENCITLQTYDPNDKINRARYDGKSSNFYFTKNEVEKFLNSQEPFIAKDIYSFADVRYLDDSNVMIVINWLSSRGKNELYGFQEYLYINGNILWEMLDAPPGYQKRILNQKLELTPKIIFSESGNKQLLKVLASPLKRRFIKALIKGFTTRVGPEKREYIFHSDFAAHSFYWQEKYPDRPDLRGIVGGLIYHRDYKDPDNINKGSFSIHT